MNLGFHVRRVLWRRTLRKAGGRAWWPSAKSETTDETGMPKASPVFSKNPSGSYPMVAFILVKPSPNSSYALDQPHSGLAGPNF
jgi:hypothetical protein